MKLSLSRILPGLPSKIQLPVRFSVYYLLNRLEREMFFVDKLKIQRRTFIDVGANYGIWSMYLASRFVNVEAFEPNEEVTLSLRNLGKSNVRLHHFGLDTVEHVGTIFIPRIDSVYVHQRASAFKNAEHNQEIRVRFTSLDKFNFENVDLIKIDVEGSEAQVLDGAISTINRNRPILIVEIELRHNAKGRETISRIESLGYSGYFLMDNKMVSISEFYFEKYQLPNGKVLGKIQYINNFIFIPIERRDEVLMDCKLG